MHSTSRLADTTSATGWEQYWRSPSKEELDKEKENIGEELEAKAEEAEVVLGAVEATKATAGCEGCTSAPFEGEGLVILRNTSYNRDIRRLRN